MCGINFESCEQNASLMQSSTSGSKSDGAVEGKPARIHRCSVLVDRFDVLKQHVGRSKESNAHRCATCGYETTNKSNLFAHVISTHVKINAFGCPLCPVAFSSHTNLSHHMRRAHQQKLGTSLRCSGCSLIFDAPLNLLAHYLEMHSHTDSAKGNAKVCTDLSKNEGSNAEPKLRSRKRTLERANLACYSDRVDIVPQEVNAARCHDSFEIVKRRMAIDRLLN